MKVFDFVWILSGVLLNAVAQLLLKAGAASAGEITLASGAPALWRTALGLAQHPAILGGLTCYAVSVVVWIIALSRVEVSIAYPMLSIGYVLNAVLAWWLFGEDLNAQRWLGIGVIIVGVVLVARSGSHT
ncbi:Undecaprenyl phosphate-aminoarabinose flippase subunit ArnF [Variovorax sp. SRS16]|uniref:SMR family transporter n=1 Tax=Variovorax sp. SRS16 TaxID=282217 RepID=UPI001315BEEC|nr:SMR family transporter [Variovorax sp. SRS16]VTU22365.1 Undecaprenyl phosphate-aminoarabinose flippase subunit ArnF [Variovorax sp. SRS16]